MPRISRVESVREMERKTDEFVTKGYKIERQSQHTTKVKEKDWGSPPVHAFLALFTFLVAAVLFDAVDVSAGAVWIVTALANATYAGYSWFTAAEVLIKVADEDAA